MHQYAHSRPSPPTATEPADVSLRRRAGADPHAAIKSLAKTMARDTTAAIPDRHVRAEVRTTCYNQIVDVLQRLADQQASQRERHYRTLMGLGGVIAVLATALTVSLMI